MGRGGASAREIRFVSLMAYGPKVSDSALAMGVTASETKQGGSQQCLKYMILSLKSPHNHCFMCPQSYTSILIYHVVFKDK